MNKRLGFFGGCFNPPTIAHIILMESAIKEANLDKIYFVPMGDSYPKEQLIEMKHRINMLNLAIKNNTKLDIFDIQKYTNKRTYAIDSLKIIDKVFKKSENYFIMGADNFQEIKNWKNSEELLNDYKYIVLDRGNFKNYNENIIIVRTSKNLSKISSSLVREKIKNKEKTDNLIIEEVQNYILENKLYI